MSERTRLTAQSRQHRSLWRRCVQDMFVYNTGLDKIEASPLLSKEVRATSVSLLTDASAVLLSRENIVDAQRQIELDSITAGKFLARVGELALTADQASIDILPAEVREVVIEAMAAYVTQAPTLAEA